MEQRDKLKKCFIKFYSAFGTGQLEPIVLNEYIEEFFDCDARILWEGIRLLVREEMEVNQSTNKIKLIWFYYHSARKKNNEATEQKKLQPARTEEDFAVAKENLKKIKEMLSGIGI